MLKSSACSCTILLFAALQPLSAQPVNERTPNLAGTWVTAPRNLYFEFSHRFQVAGPDENITDIFSDGKIVNYPTFDLTYGIVDNVMAAIAYSTNSPVGSIPNEWQPFLKWAPIPLTGTNAPSLSVVAAYNGAAKSFDGELSGQAQLGPVIVIGAARGFTSPYDLDAGGAFALGGGLGLRVSRYITFAGDINGIVAGLSDFETPVAWSASFALGIPYTPHTFSLMVTNVRSGTLEGTSVGVPGTAFWGFEFTVPFSALARSGGVSSPEEAVEQAREPGAGDVVVEVEIKSFQFSEKELRVPQGTTVRWVNRDPVGHTSTADDGEWTSPLIGPGGTYQVRFSETGTFDYHCQPHPFMTASVTVMPRD